MRRIWVSGYTSGLIIDWFWEKLDMTTEGEEIVEFNSAMTAFETKQFSTAAQLLTPFAEKR